MRVQGTFRPNFSELGFLSKSTLHFMVKTMLVCMALMELGHVDSRGCLHGNDCIDSHQCLGQPLHLGDPLVHCVLVNQSE